MTTADLLAEIDRRLAWLQLTLSHSIKVDDGFADDLRQRAGELEALRECVRYLGPLSLNLLKEGLLHTSADIDRALTRIATRLEGIKWWDREREKGQAMTKLRIELDEAERDLVLAALQYWQDANNRRGRGVSGMPPVILEIATNGGTHAFLPEKAIELLRDKINKPIEGAEEVRAAFPDGMTYESLMNGAAGRAVLARLQAADGLLEAAKKNQHHSTYCQCEMCLAIADYEQTGKGAK